MMINEAIILVGGTSTRMGLSTSKCLLEKNGKSVLEHIADNFRKNGIDDITLMTGDLDESPKAERPEFDNLGYKTIRNLKDYKPKGDYVVSVGDIIVDFDLKKMYEHHNQQRILYGSEVTVLTTDLEIPYGVIENSVWKEKPIKEIALGVFVVNNDVKGNSIPDLVSNDYSTFKIDSEFTHLTKQEDYEKWKNS